VTNWRHLLADASYDPVTRRPQIGLENTDSPQAQWFMDLHTIVVAMLFFFLTDHICMSLMHTRSSEPLFPRSLPQLKKSSRS